MVQVRWPPSSAEDLTAWRYAVCSIQEEPGTDAMQAAADVQTAEQV